MRVIASSVSSLCALTSLTRQETSEDLSEAVYYREFRAGIPLPLHVPVQVNDVSAARNVIEGTQISGDFIKDDGDFRLRHGGRAGIVDIRDHESLDAFTQPVDNIALTIPQRSSVAIPIGHKLYARVVPDINILVRPS